MIVLLKKSIICLKPYSCKMGYPYMRISHISLNMSNANRNGSIWMFTKAHVLTKFYGFREVSYPLLTKSKIWWICKGNIVTVFLQGNLILRLGDQLSLQEVLLPNAFPHPIFIVKDPSFSSYCQISLNCRSNWKSPTESWNLDWESLNLHSSERDIGRNWTTQKWLIAIDSERKRECCRERGEW